MIISFENGRLGNQLFQYSGLDYYFPGDRKILIGYDELNKLISTKNTIFINKRYFINSFILKSFEKLIFIFLHYRIFTKAIEINNKNNYEIHFYRGLFSFIKILVNSQFQNNEIERKISAEIKIKTPNIDCANIFINSFFPNIKFNRLVFVHIRRGDYVSWPSVEMPAVLPLSWYKMAFKRIESQIKDPVYLVFSDDIPYASDFLGKNKNFYIIKENNINSLSIMSLCGSGIMSASSFSWWAGYFSSRYYKEINKTLFVGPERWIGYNSNDWFPKHFYFEWIYYQ